MPVAFRQKTVRGKIVSQMLPRPNSKKVKRAIQRTEWAIARLDGRRKCILKGRVLTTPKTIRQLALENRIARLRASK